MDGGAWEGKGFPNKNGTTNTQELAPTRQLWREVRRAKDDGAWNGRDSPIKERQQTTQSLDVQVSYRQQAAARAFQAQLQR